MALYRFLKARMLNLRCRLFHGKHHFKIRVGLDWFGVWKCDKCGESFMTWRSSGWGINTRN